MGTFTHTRRPDWTVRWIEFMKDSLDLKDELALNWEDITCTSWTGDGIEALTGFNPYEDFRGKHTSIMGACKLIKKAGFDSLDALIASLFNEVPLGMAQQGDLVLIRALPWDIDVPETALFAQEVMPHGIALADPPHFWAVTEVGLGRGDLYTQGVRAFAVGRQI